jgi:uncharacterized membrane protein HdeD (DUF308 family)
MDDHAPRSDFGTPCIDRGVRGTAREITGYWWLWLVAGIVWIVVSQVILQFDSASVTTVGILVGLLFMFASVESFALLYMPETGDTRWIPAIFGGLFLLAATICFVNPQGTFATLADILGFLFAVVGIWWIVRAFLERAANPLWWLGLRAGILMTVLAFWAAGQFFVEKAYVLRVFAGIWGAHRGHRRHRARVCGRPAARGGVGIACSFPMEMIESVQEATQQAGAGQARQPQSAAAPPPFTPIAEYGFLSNCHTGVLRLAKAIFEHANGWGR